MTVYKYDTIDGNYEQQALIGLECFRILLFTHLVIV